MSSAAHLLKALAAAAIAALFAAPCLAADVAVFEVAIQQNRFVPERIEVPSGQKFKLRVKNEGPGAEEFESSDLNREKVVRPGAGTDIFLGPLSPGEYKFFGEFHPDSAKGVIVAK